MHLIVRFWLHEAFIVVVNCHRKRLFGFVLTDDVLVEVALHFERFDEIKLGGGWFFLFLFRIQFFLNYAVALLNAKITNVGIDTREQ